MINRIQVNVQKSNSGKVQSRPIVPLSRNVNKEQTNDKLKELRRPRSRKYIQNLIELQELLSELDKQRRKAGTNHLSDMEDSNHRQDGFGSTDSVNHEPSRAGEPTNSSSQQQIKETFETEETGLGNIVVGESSQQQREDQVLISNPVIDELEKRIQEKMEQLGKENARISELLALLYPSDNEEYLIECGVISRPGTPVYSREDMAVDVEDPREAEQLKRGYDLYSNYVDSPDFLTIEIYIDAYCIIYKDGIVKTIV